MSVQTEPVVDAGDASPEAAALREAHEEIGLDPEVTVLRPAPLSAETTVGHSDDTTFSGVMERSWSAWWGR